MIIPGVIISKEQYEKLFWNTITDSFVKPVNDQWIVFFKEGREDEAKEWAKVNDGQFIHVNEDLIKPRYKRSRFERENPEYCAKIREEIAVETLRATREYFMFGMFTIKKSVTG